MVIADEQTPSLPSLDLDASVVSREQFNRYLRKRNLTILDVSHWQVACDWCMSGRSRGANRSRRTMPVPFAKR